MNKSTDFNNMYDMSSNLKNISNNPLKSLFFCKDNIIIIQNAIRYKVWKQSNQQFMIGNQSLTELEIVMRSVYMQYSKNRNDNLTEQIDNLNKIVVNDCIKVIISNIKQYVNYKKNIDKTPQLMEHPVNVSNAGSKTLKNIIF